MARGNKGRKFFVFFAKPSAAPYRNKGMGKNTISAGFLALACGDVIALSQFSLSFWEALAFGALCVISYGFALWSAFAE